jgi:lipoyl(octanoyl) transferase
MTVDVFPGPTPTASETTLRVYLLGVVDLEAALALQRSLVYQVSHEGHSPALILCEHRPIITVGRHGSPAHLHFDRQELERRGWRTRWVNRGGGCLLHLPGQLAIYPIMPLRLLGLGIAAYLRRLQQVVLDLLDDFSIRAHVRPDGSGVWVGRRLIAEVGIAVRHWTAYYGIALNVSPDLAPYRLIQNGSWEDGPMTSLERERHGPLRPALVRELFLEHFTKEFGFHQPAIFFNHPTLPREPAERVLLR